MAVEPASHAPRQTTARVRRTGTRSDHREAAVVTTRTLVFDIDGTLVPHDGEPHPRLLPTLRSCRERGWRLLVATARRRSSALVRLGPLAELLHEGVFNNGACTWLGHELHVHHGLPATVTAAAFDAVSRWPGIDGASLALADERIAFDRRLDAAVYRQWGVDAGHLCSAEEALAAEPIRLCAWSETADLHALACHLEELHGADCLIQVVDRGRCLFITPLGIDKQTAVAALCDGHAIPAAATIAFGDDVSDVGLLRWAGAAVAMRDGHVDTIAIADHLVEPAADGGIALLLEHLLAVGHLDGWH